MRLRALLPVLALAGLVLTGCGSSDEGTVTSGSGAQADTTITVTATDDACTLSATTATAGSIAFAVTNSGSKTNEFYVYENGQDVVGEVENIGAGLTRTLTVQDVAAGTYVTACKPGMSGDGIRADFVVS